MNGKKLKKEAEKKKGKAMMTNLFFLLTAPQVR